MKHYYTNERNHQIIIALLKAHNIRYVVASPGTTNSVFVGSIQNDSFFTIYSVVDERSAAYTACGLALEIGEPVVISCTGATAARNYMPGATEAFYGKLPILILTSSQPNNRAGHLIAQVTDRTNPPSDTCILSETLPIVKSADEEWECEVKANKALLELKRHGGGPVHLNLITTYSFSSLTALTQKELPPCRVMHRYFQKDQLPQLPNGRVGIFVGSHRLFDEATVVAIEKFCEVNNGVVFCDHTSNYNGKYKILYALAINQADLNKSNIPAYQVDVLIHIGEISGEEGAMRMIRGNQTWRVSEDGEIRDTFGNLKNIFEMSEQKFFEYYSHGISKEAEYFNECMNSYQRLFLRSREQLIEMPFSNTWIGAQMAPEIPKGSTVVLSILNTLRNWNYSEFRAGVKVYSPVGGFGIDGATSLLLGASLGNPKHPCYLVTGDLAFFYDLNTLGNRHIGKNVRIVLINNGMGVEFKKPYAMAYRLLEDEIEPYVSAPGHFGNMSHKLVRHMAEDLGFEYFAASDKNEFQVIVPRLATPEITEKPMLVEVFVDACEDILALNMIQNR